MKIKVYPITAYIVQLTIKHGADIPSATWQITPITLWSRSDYSAYKKHRIHLTYFQAWAEAECRNQGKPYPLQFTPMDPIRLDGDEEG